MMHRIRIQGWKAGRRVDPISFMRVIQSLLGLTLREAKDVLDAFSENGEVTVEVQDSVTAAKLSADVVALGAICEPQ